MNHQRTSEGNNDLIATINFFPNGWIEVIYKDGEIETINSQEYKINGDIEQEISDDEKDFQAEQETRRSLRN